MLFAIIINIKKNILMITEYFNNLKNSEGFK